MLGRLLLLVTLVAACGPSTAEVRAASSSVYQVDFPVVWTAVANSVHEHYSRVIIEDPIAGVLLTDWHMVERLTQDEVSQANPGGASAGVGPGQLPAIGGKFFRIKVEIKPGGPPWRVVVDGEAALYTPGMALIQPYDHGDADEPAWVKTRVEKVRVAIHRKLGKYAKVSREPVKTTELSTAPWDGLPGDAPATLAKIHSAAKKKDVGALRKHMVEAFVWSSGGEPSADTALSLWSADPLVLSALVSVLEGGCAERDAETIVCPKRELPGSSWRAELKKSDKAWRLAAFFQE